MDHWLLGGIILAAVCWFTRTGTCSYLNYTRIHPGMPLSEVERLLGSPGTEIPESQLPGIVDWEVPVDHPKRVKAVVSGERYYVWNQGGPKSLSAFVPRWWLKNRTGSRAFE